MSAKTRPNRLMDAYSSALDAQSILYSAMAAVGEAERLAIEARLDGEPDAASFAQKKVRAARASLRRAVLHDRAAYDNYRAIEEDLDAKRRKREAAKARRKAASAEVAA